MDSPKKRMFLLNSFFDVQWRRTTLFSDCFVNKNILFKNRLLSCRLTTTLIQIAVYQKDKHYKNPDRKDPNKQTNKSEIKINKWMNKKKTQVCWLYQALWWAHVMQVAKNHGMVFSVICRCNLVIVYHPFCMNTLFPFGASSYADQENKNDEN